MSSSSQTRTFRRQTQLASLGLAPQGHGGAVNMPLYRASTILFPDLASLDGEKPVGSRYGLHSTPLLEALSQGLCALENAKHCVLASSGLEAVALAALSSMKSGDLLHMSDGAYGPTQKLCNDVLPRFDIATRYYDPTRLQTLESDLSENSKLVWIETPSSQTFEMTDIPALLDLTRKHERIITLADNSWGGGIAFRPLDLGVDIVLQSGTKYIGGHSDSMLGFCATNSDSLAADLLRMRSRLGIYNAPDEMYLALRGLRSITVRYRAHGQTALELCSFWQQQPETRTILYPALSSHPQHSLWQRDFSGSCGLFSVLIEKRSRTALAHFTDELQLFGIGYSWGSFKSLLLPSPPKGFGRRLLPDVPSDCWLLRIHAGLEDPHDLKEDLAEGLVRYRAQP